MKKLLRYIFKPYEHHANGMAAIIHCGVGYQGSIIRQRIRHGRQIHHGVGYCGINE